MTSGREVAEAFENGYSMQSGNYFTDGKVYCLFGNRIAEKRDDGIYFSNCGYLTVTTSKALNFLKGVSYSCAGGKVTNQGIEIESDKFYKVRDPKFLEEITN